MGSSFSVGGLISGLDTDSIIAALVNVKNQQLITPLENRILELSAQQSALESVQDAMRSFQSTASTLRNQLDFEGRTSTSSDTSTVLIKTLSANSIKGTYNINVNALAQADRNYFEGVADKNLTQFGTGTISITSSGSTIAVEIDSSNNTLEGIRDAINAADGPVTASIVNDGDASNPYRLVLTSNETGADSDITHDIDSVLTLVADAALDALTSNEGQDAEVVVNGLTIYGETNTISEAIPGMSFELLQTHTDTADPIVVGVSSDYSATMNNIASFINAYNEVVAKFKDQFSVDTATGQSTGVLSSDVTLQSAQNRINSIMLTQQSQLAGLNTQTLAQLGITLNDEGYLTLDQNELETALGDDVNEVRMFFQGTADNISGLADRVYEYLNGMVNLADGIFTQKNRIWQNSIDDLLDLMSEREDRIATFEATTRAKFIYMEQTLLSLNQQSSALEASQTQLEQLQKQGSG